METSHQKYFKEKVNSLLRTKAKEVLGIKLGLFATHADLLDKITEKGYWIELSPFHTFALEGRVAFFLKIWKRNEEGIWKLMYDEQKTYNGEGYGSSFYYAIRLALLKISKDLKKQQNENI